LKRPRRTAKKALFSSSFEHMSQVSLRRDIGVRRVLGLEAGIAIIVALGAAAWHGTAGLYASAYGAAITLSMTWWMGQRIQRASVLAAKDPGRGMAALFGGLAQKYLFAIVALAVGFALRLDGPALLAGFGLTHLAFWIVGLWGGPRNEHQHRDPKGS